MPLAALILLLALLAACGGGGEAGPVPPTPPPGEPAPSQDAAVNRETTVDGIEYAASSSLTGGSVRVVARMRNASDSPREVTFPDGCVVLVRAYADAARSGAPAWDQRDHAFCTMALQMVTLQPGETREHEMTAEVEEMLATGAPEGELHLSAYLRPDGGAVEVPAGAVTIRR